MGASDPVQRKPIGTVLSAALGRWGTRPAALVQEGGEWAEIRAAELRAWAGDFAAGLRTYGAEPGDRIALLSADRIEALVADLAIQLVAGVAVVPHPDAAPTDLTRILRDLEVRQVLASDRAALARVLGIRAELPALDLVLVLDRGADPDTVLAATAAQRALAVGEARLAGEPALLEDTLRPIGEVAPAVVIPTPAGPGTFLNQRDVLAAVEALEATLPLVSGDVVLNLLPPWRAAHRTVRYSCMIQGAIVTFPEPDRDLASILEDLRPTVVLAERPAVEDLARALRRRCERGGSWESRLRSWVIGPDRDGQHPRVGRRCPPAKVGLGKRAARRWVLLPFVRQATGSRLRALASIGDALSRQVLKDLAVMGVPILEGVDRDRAGGVLSLGAPVPAGSDAGWPHPRA